MPKRKSAGLVLLAYSDSEHEDEDNVEDEEEEKKDSESNELFDYDEEVKDDEDQQSIDNNDQSKNEVISDLYFEDIYGDKNLSILEFHQSLFGKNSDEISVPPVTKMNCSSELQDQIENLHEKVKNGYDLNRAIQKRKSMRNPSIYEKMISYCQIDEMATNYPKEIYNPEPFLSNDSYYEELSKVQKEEMEKREKERKEIDKTNNSKKINTGFQSSNEKKSKWDSAVTSTSAAMAAALAAANKVKHLNNQLSTNLSNKPTVISAFGTISKKK